MSKRVADKERESKGDKKKSKKETKESKWRSKILAKCAKQNDPRIKEAVAVALSDHHRRPIILILSRGCQCISNTFYEYLPCNQLIGERVLNTLLFLHTYGHQEETYENTKDALACNDAMVLAETMAGTAADSTQEAAHARELISVYFETTLECLGAVNPLNDSAKLYPFLYFQECYGYY